jgi:hypothetical protein
LEQREQGEAAEEEEEEDPKKAHTYTPRSDYQLS